MQLCYGNSGVSYCDCAWEDMHSPENNKKLMLGQEDGSAGKALAAKSENLPEPEW